MIKPAPFDEANGLFKLEVPKAIEEVLAAQTEELLPLPYFFDGKRTIVCYQLDDADLEELRDTKKLWIIIIGAHIPVMRVGIEFPFEIKDEFAEFIDDNSGESEA